jgi:hypothetical protein
MIDKGSLEKEAMIISCRLAARSVTGFWVLCCYMTWLKANILATNEGILESGFARIVDISGHLW